MRKLISALSTLALLAPVAAQAQFAEPTDILSTAVTQSHGLPFDFRGEFHGHYQGYWASLWLTGSGQKDENSRSAAKITVDVANQGNTLRAKLETRMVEKKMYVMIQSVTGKMENEFITAALQATGKKWIMSDVMDGELATSDESQAMEFAQYLRLDSVKTDSVGNTLYTLILTRDAARELSRELRNITELVPQQSVPRIALTVTVTLDRDNRPIKTAVDFAAETVDAGITGTLTATRRSSPVTVQVPAGAVDTSSLPFLGLPDVPDFSMPVDDGSSSSADDSWMNDYYGNDFGPDGQEEQPTASPNCTLAQIRNGECQATRFNRRSLNSSSAASLPEGTNVPDISNADYYRGDANATVTIVEYADLQCPFCKQFHAELNQALKDYPGRVNVVFRHFPLSFHNNANTLSNAAECVGAQAGSSAFWSFVDAVYGSSTDVADWTDSDIAALALPKDPAAYQTCMQAHTFQILIDAQAKAGETAGINGTPTSILINHRTGKRVQVMGAVPYEELKAQLDAILR